MEVLICPGCKQLYKEPMLLKCTHSLCVNCCQRLFDPINCQIQCVVCQQYTPTTTPRGLILNAELNALVIRISSYQQQQPQQLESQQDLPFVDLTNLQLVSAAEGIQRAARGENVRAVEEAAGALREQVRAQIHRLRSFAPELQRRQRTVEALCEDLNQSAEAAEQNIRKHFEELRGAVNARESELLTQQRQLFAERNSQYEQLLTQTASQMQAVNEAEQFDYQNETASNVCRAFLKLKAASQQLEVEQFTADPRSNVRFIADDNVIRYVQLQQMVITAENYDVQVAILSEQLKVQPRPCYDLNSERAGEDVASVASNYLAAVETKKIQNKQAVTTPDGVFDARAATLALATRTFSSLPHELFSGVRGYFSQTVEFYQRLLEDLTLRIRTLTVLGEQVRKSAFGPPTEIAVPASDFGGDLLRNLAEELRSVGGMFRQISDEFQQQLVPFTEQSQRTYAAGMAKIFELFQKEVVEYDQRQTQLKSLQDDVCQLLNKYEAEEQKQLELVRANSEAKRQQSVAVRRAEQLYNQKLNQFQAQLKVFLTFELNTRRKCCQYLADLEQLEANRLSFVQQLQRHQHRIVSRAISGVMHAQLQSISLADISLQKVVLQGLYCVLRQQPQITQISPMCFKAFRPNLNETYLAKLASAAVNTEESSKAPYGSIGQAKALFDYEPEGEVAGDALPLREGQRYWIFEWDAAGWSVISSQAYPAVKAVAPSNYLQALQCYQDYKWSGAVLKVCGGELELTAPKAVQEVKRETEEYQRLKTVVAVFSFDPENSDEISLREGDKLTVEGVEDDWVRGVNQRTGKVGLFPANYVE